jgi:hypothetical protein
MRLGGRLSTLTAVSYDVEVATHAEPGAFEAPDGVTVDGPFRVEPDDLAEPLAAAVLAPRWLTTVSAASADPARKLGRRIAKLHDGAAFDPQEDVVFYPRGKPKRTVVQKPAKTSIVRLEWYVDAERWPDAPAALLRTLSRRCPEALPTRYGDFEPLQQRYDPAEPEAFAGFARDQQTFWFSSRPAFGGHAFEPERGRPGHLGVDVDWRVLEADERWREAIVGVFAAAADALGAFYGESWVEPGWNVSRNNRLSIAAGRKTRPAAVTHDGRVGLPPVAAWLTWFGGEYRDGVAAALAGSRPRRRGLRRAVTIDVTEYAGGVCVRLGARPRAKLPALPLPAEVLSRRAADRDRP